MEEIINLLTRLVHIQTVSGFEKDNAKEILYACSEYARDCFDEAYVTKSGSVVLAKYGKGENRRVLCFDAHLDTIGFAVTQICDDGYVRVTNMGGIDVNILPSSNVLIHGKETIRGVFTSVPPHLSHSDKLPEISQLFVDTGLASRQKVQQIIDIGTPVTMYPHVTRLLNNNISGTGFDDKICITAIMQGLKLLKDVQLENTDIYCFFSSGEERGGNGSYHMYHDIKPDACVVLDVNFAKEKGSKQGEYGRVGEGSMLSVSSVTNKKLTQLCKDSAKEKSIPLQTVVEMTGTGTNADVCARTGKGIATAVVSVPLKYMHSSVELACIDDVQNTAKLLCAVAEKYDKEPVGIPVYHKGGTGLGL